MNEPMIRTVTLNPAVDRTVTIESFSVNTVNRIAASRKDAGGKGINVSKAVHGFGRESAAYGFLAGSSGRFIDESLAALGIERRFTWIDGETRTNMKIVDPLLGTHTDINDRGPEISAEDLRRLEAALFEGADGDTVFVFSGSLGAGPDLEIYGRWISRAKNLGARSLLDADGDALRLGAASGPTVLKPNIDELERLVGRSLRIGQDVDIPAAVSAASGLLMGGTELVVVSLGADGALFADARRRIRAYGLPIRALSTVGAGDAMVASLILSLRRGDDLETMVAPAVAAGTAAAATEGTAIPNAAAVAFFMPMVRYEFL